MTTYAELLDAWLASPSPVTLAPLHDAIRSAPGPGAVPDVAQRADALLTTEAYAAAVDLLQAAMPGALLSPGLHGRLAFALRRLGRGQDAERHARLAEAALAAITSSGDGTATRPWRVLRTADEYDLLDSLGARPVSQGVLREGQRTLDRIVCIDGREAHFDVTELLPLAHRA
jgi:hypothetical protein